MQVDNLGVRLRRERLREQLTWSRPRSPTMTKKLLWFAFTPFVISAGIRGSNCFLMLLNVTES